MTIRSLSLLPLVTVALYLSATTPLAAQGRGRGGGGMSQVDHPASGPSGASSQAGSTSSAKGRDQAAHGSGESAVSDKLAENTRLTSKVASLLPAGTNIQDAAKGFKNLGQFVAAVHVSHNLDIPFDQLKSEIQTKGSLGKAIHALKPDLTNKAVKEAVDTAEKEAKQDVETSEGKMAKSETSTSGGAQK